MKRCLAALPIHHNLLTNARLASRLSGLLEGQSKNAIVLNWQLPKPTVNEKGLTEAQLEHSAANFMKELI